MWNKNTAALLLLTMGCVSSVSTLMVVALILFLWDFYAQRESYPLQEIFSQSLVKKTLLCLGIFLFLFALSGFLSGSKRGVEEAGHYIERFLPFVFAVLLTYKRKTVWPPVLWGIFGGSLIVFVSAVVEIYSQHLNRFRSVLGNPNCLGGWAILLLPFILAGLYYYRHEASVKYLAAGAGIITLICLAGSKSRGAMGALAVMILVGIFMAWRRTFKAAIVGLVLGAIFVGVLFSLSNNLGSGLLHRNYDQERVLLRQSGTQMFLDHPWLGVGWNNFNKVYVQQYISPSAKEAYLFSPHNFVLHYLDESGLLGTSGLLILLGGQFYCLMRHTVKKGQVNWWAFADFVGFVGMWAHGMVDIINMNRFYMMLYSFLWGLTCYAIWQQENSKVKGQDRRSLEKKRR